jgi:hypothetical protein
MTDRQGQALQVIRDYIKRKKGLVTMEEIHNRIFEENQTFTTWKSVEEFYESVEWEQEKFEEFLLTAREHVEGGFDRISESYFDIQQPENLTTQLATNMLDEALYDENPPEDEEPDGFRYETDEDGVVHARYIHTDVRTNVTATGEVDQLTSEDAVTFRIHPDQQLMVVESTYPPDVQRMKGAIRKKTSMAATVCGSLSSNYEEANARVKNFQDSFEEFERPGEDIEVNDNDE